MSDGAWRAAGAQALHDNGTTLGAELGDFWQWASSRLAGNTLRGWSAEYLVSVALGERTAQRIEWDGCDLRLASGHRLEVKSSAYLQAWPQARPTSPSFSVRAARQPWDAETNAPYTGPQPFSHAFVFALHAHQNAATSEPCNVAQWRFWVVPASQFVGRTRIGISALERLAGEAVAFRNLRARVGEVLTTLPASPVQ